MKLFHRRRNKHAERNLNICRVLNANGIDLFIDIGANVGQTGHALRKGGYEGRIISVEPVKACHETLCVETASDPLWEVAERCALGQEETTRELLVSEASDLSSLADPTEALVVTLPKAKEATREQVAVRRVDTLLRDAVEAAERPLLKVDTQGNDLAVLRGAEGVLARIHGVQIEMSLLPLYEGEALYSEVLNYLTQHGFEPHILTDKTFSRQLNRQLQIDGVFIRRSNG